MNSWQLIKQRLTGGSAPHSFGFNVDMVRAAKLFLALCKCKYLDDAAQAKRSFYEDDDVSAALAYCALEDQLRAAGMMR